MDFFKGLVLSLLSLFLFMSLSTFGGMMMLKQTLLDPAFAISQVDRLDVSLLAEELLSEHISEEEEFAAEVVSITIADLEPWMKEQASALIYSGYDYFMGRSRDLSLAVPLEPVKDSLKENLREVLLESLPPEIAEAPPELVEQYINEIYQQIAENIPATFKIDEGLWGAEVQAILDQVKDGVGYFDLGYGLLIGFILLLLLGVFFIRRPVRSALRHVGIIFFILWGHSVCRHFHCYSYCWNRASAIRSAFSTPDMATTIP